MGFLSKVWKGIKKGFKAIFKPIKKVFKGFGKFMNKIGIVGQIAMMFIPFGQILGPMMKGFAQFGGKFLTGLSKMGSLGNAAATVIGKGVEFAQLAKAGYQTVTKAVTGFFKTTGKWIGGKLGMTKFKGLTWEKAWGDYSKSLVDSWDNLGSKAAEFWDTDIKGATVEYNKTLGSTAAGYSSEFMDDFVPGEGVTPVNKLEQSVLRGRRLEAALNAPDISSTPAGYSDDIMNNFNQSTVTDGATTAPTATTPPVVETPAVTAVDAPKSLLDKTVQFGKDLPGNTAKGVTTSMISQYAMGAIQGEPEMDMSVPFGPRLGAYTPDSVAPIGVPGTEQPMSNYGQFVAQDTSYSNVPAQSQNYLGSSVWEQLMASYNKQQYPTAMG